MKKPLLLLVPLLLLSLLLPAAAATLSPAVDCLAGEVELVKSGTVGSPLLFAPSDFMQALGTRSVERITVVTLPAPEEGALTLGNSAVRPGQTLPLDAVSRLRFTPAGNETRESSFLFRAGEVAGGATVLCRMRFTDGKNEAPTALAPESAVTVTAGIASFGTLSASDPEGDLVTFSIIDHPLSGTLTLPDAKTGEYRYEPKAGFVGEDVFRFVARDEYGNWSRPVTVSLSVESAPTSYVFADMTEKREHGDALLLSSLYLMQGEIAGDSFFFHPEGEVTRADFTVMAMKAASVRPIAGLSESCFDDNGDISPALRPYVATAQRFGIVHGDFADGRLTFDPDRSVTVAEAAVILSRLLDLEEPDTLPTVATEGTVPAWARGAVGALFEAGIYPEGADASAPLTRAAAAGMLGEVVRSLK